jgi:hypothetical protein
MAIQLSGPNGPMQLSVASCVVQHFEPNGAMQFSVANCSTFLLQAACAYFEA